MSKEQQDKKAEEIMDFRYSIIAELLNPYMARVERRNLMHEKAKRQHEIPYSNRTRVSYECIKKVVHDLPAVRQRGVAAKCAIRQGEVPSASGRGGGFFPGVP